MVQAKTILKKKLYDTVHKIPLSDILNSGLWIAGDYKPAGNDCTCMNFYHDCGNRVLNMRYVLDSLISPDSVWALLFKEIKVKGFRTAVTAIANMDHTAIVIVDGHNRLSIARELGRKQVPVYIANPAEIHEELIAFDSQHWTPGTIGYPWLIDNNVIV